MESVEVPTPNERRVQQPFYRAALILPGLLVAGVLGVFFLTVTTRGADMSPLLLLPLFALPWSLLSGALDIRDGPAACLTARVPACSASAWWLLIVIGWLINAALLFAVGYWIDYRLWLHRRRQFGS
jgi:hypothetical protein